MISSISSRTLTCEPHRLYAVKICGKMLNGALQIPRLRDFYSHCRFGSARVIRWVCQQRINKDARWTAQQQLHNKHHMTAAYGCAPFVAHRGTSTKAQRMNTAGNDSMDMVWAIANTPASLVASLPSQGVGSGFRL